MKKNVLNNFIFILSIMYLIIFAIIKVLNMFSLEISLFDDGLTLIGTLFAVFELLLSKRNSISKFLNSLIFYNKSINYKVLISFSTDSLTKEEFVEEFENSLKDFFSITDLKRRPLKDTKKSINISYDNIGCEITCYYNCEDNDIGIKIIGNTKYGKILSNKNDIMYFSSLIKILGNKYLVSNNIIKYSSIEKIEIFIMKNGSQIENKNLFNESIENTHNFNVIIKENNDEITINNKEIKWVTTDKSSLISNFVNFTDILCSIE